MQLNLRELFGKQHHIHLTEHIDIADIVQNEPSIHSASPLTVKVDATSEINMIVVNGQVAGELELVCSRCLNVFPSHADFSFEELFSNEKPSEDEESLDEEEQLIHYVTEDKIDLVPYIEEHVVLELPRFPICDKHCKGLCPTCGRNRNTEDCTCNNEKIDPRWSGLNDLFQS